MKKLVFLMIICMALASCKTASNVSKKPLYFKQYQKGSITESEYQFLCKGESELINYKFIRK